MTLNLKEITNKEVYSILSHDIQKIKSNLNQKIYKERLEALKALWKAVNIGIGIPLKCPTDKNGNTLKAVSTSVASNRFKGFVSHYHITRRKIDCAGLDINSMLKEIK